VQLDVDAMAKENPYAMSRLLDDTVLSFARKASSAMGRCVACVCVCCMGYVCVCSMGVCECMGRCVACMCVFVWVGVYVVWGMCMCVCMFWHVCMCGQVRSVHVCLCVCVGGGGAGSDNVYVLLIIT